MHDVNYLNYDDEEICDGQELEDKKSDKSFRRSDIVKKCLVYDESIDITPKINSNKRLRTNNQQVLRESISNSFADGAQTKHIFLTLAGKI